MSDFTSLYPTYALAMTSDARAGRDLPLPMTKRKGGEVILIAFRLAQMQGRV